MGTLGPVARNGKRPRGGTGTSLSLGDRLCLALGKRLGATVLTADKAWGEGKGIEQVR